MTFKAEAVAGSDEWIIRIRKNGRIKGKFIVDSTADKDAIVTALIAAGFAQE